MKIYIADLASYNSGKFDGKWFDLNDYTDAEELKDAISDWREERGIEDYAVHEYDGCPAQDKFGGAPDFDELFNYHMFMENTVIVSPRGLICSVTGNTRSRTDISSGTTNL